MNEKSKTTLSTVPQTTKLKAKKDNTSQVQWDQMKAKQVWTNAMLKEIKRAKNKSISALKVTFGGFELESHHGMC